MFTLVHPQAVSPLKIAGQVVPNGVVYSVLAFMFLYFMTIAVLTFALLISGLDLTSALSAIVACINNAGPGLNLVGPSTNYSTLNDFQSWICIAGDVPRPRRDHHLRGAVHAHVLAQVRPAAG